ncbi:ATP-binding protein [Polluticaenibacter yanchengensis]|uniref:histidine kinase n=1 Tax=Polluticaenibacter yanchengensis TaxID=3014562 RepID=A0ABT4UNE8_9BACT|nr:hypothetical protein [Chitinophagaceae bacterium LY-5]
MRTDNIIHFNNNKYTKWIFRQHHLLKVLLTIFISGNPLQIPAQLSDSLYYQLPADKRPQQRNALTTNERLAILNASNDFGYGNYKEELDKIVKEVLLDISVEKDLSKKSAYTFIITDFLPGHEAINCYQQLIESIGESPGHERSLAKAYIGMATPYIYADRLDSAMNMLQQGLYYAEKLHDNDLSGEIYQTYTVIYGKLALYEKALTYSKKAVVFFNEKEDKLNYIKCAITAAYMYAINFQKNAQSTYLDTARNMIREVMYSEKKEASFWYGACYHALGFFNYLQKDYQSALVMFDSSLLPAYNYESRYNPNYYFVRYLYKGVCLVKTGKIADGIAILLNLKVTNKSYPEQLLRYSTLYEYSKQKGDYKNALMYHELVRNYSDSLSLEEQKGVIFETEQKYAAAQKEKIIAGLETEKIRTQARHIKIFSIIVIALLLAALAALMFYLIARWQRANFLGFKLNVARNIHDETGPALLYAKVLAKSERTRKNETVKSELELHLEHTMEIIRSLSHDLKSEEQYTTASLINKCKEVLKKLNISDEFTYNISDKTNANRFLSHFQFSNLKSILQECITNTIKHASFTVINIDFIKNGNKLYISYSDNGKGWPKDSKAEGIGMVNMRERMDKLNGGFTIVNNYPDGYQLNMEIALQ